MSLTRIPLTPEDRLMVAILEKESESRQLSGDEVALVFRALADDRATCESLQDELVHIVSCPDFQVCAECGRRERVLDAKAWTNSS